MSSIEGLKKFGANEVAPTPQGTLRAEFVHEHNTGVDIIFTPNEAEHELVIKNIYTWPVRTEGKGMGSKSLKAFLAWAKSDGYTHIRAERVVPEAATFWIKHDFKYVPWSGRANDYEYVAR